MSLCIVAGERSADLYGARIVKQLKGIPVWGVGGNSLLAAGQEQILTLDNFQVMGFSDVIKKLPTLVKSFSVIQNAILTRNPTVLCIIDQPSFGLRLAKSLRKKGYAGKIVQFVAPTVWAYNPKRADLMAKSFDLLLTLFPFEPAYFAHTKLKTIFVGHPILEIMAQSSTDTLNLQGPVLSLFPGSRPDEIRRNLPKQLEAARMLKQKIPDLQIAIAAAGNASFPKDVLIVPFEQRYELMQKSTLAIAKCGTVTLELALQGVPTVVTYELSLLNRLVAKHILHVDKLPYYSIANILSKKELFPELIKPPVSGSAIYEKALLLLSEYEVKKEDCLAVKNQLQAFGTATELVAKELRGLLC
jgi:lipid-A-disaccharide synthase